MRNGPVRSSAMRAVRCGHMCCMRRVECGAVRSRVLHAAVKGAAAPPRCVRRGVCGVQYAVCEPVSVRACMRVCCVVCVRAGRRAVPACEHVHACEGGGGWGGGGTQTPPTACPRACVSAAYHHPHIAPTLQRPRCHQHTNAGVGCHAHKHRV